MRVAAEVTWLVGRDLDGIILEQTADEAQRQSSLGEITAPLISRRLLLAQMAAGVAALAVSSSCGHISPRRARAEAVQLTHLTGAEGHTLEALGDTLLPGAAEAGIAHYIDDQLGRDNPLLFLKYMDWTGGYAVFYKDGLAALDRYSRERNGKSFVSSSLKERTVLVGEISTASPVGWKGAPAPLFYFVTRNDAVDVFYGTPEGLQSLAVPYMAHIVPPQKW
jgi:hypothetical protein